MFIFLSGMSFSPKPPPYQQRSKKKHYTGGFYGKPCPPHSPHFLIMSSPIMSNGHSPLPPILACLPRGFVPLDNQVAGHTFQENNPHEMGLLKQPDGTILKPAGKAMCGIREINFYQNLLTTDNPELVQLRELVPAFKGVEKLVIDNREISFIKLEDLTDRFYEPCVIDIKIGRRTWDPLASEEKRVAEESKYADCKQSLGLCIPGFQVHSVKNGRVRRYGKEYGKKLNENTIKDALRLFLNADSGLCRSLLMQLLSGLWAIQSWARSQKGLRIYSSSILLVYDARRLRNNLEMNRKRSPNGNTTATIASTPVINGNPFHWNMSTSSSSSASSPGTPTTPNSLGEPIKYYKKIQRNHSTQNNYDQVSGNGFKN